MNHPRPGDLAWPLAPIGRHSAPLTRSRWLWLLADAALMLGVLHLLGVV